MKPEIFFLPYGEEEILYAPLIKFIAVVNKHAKNAVAKKLAGLPADISEEGVLDTLEKKGVFSEDVNAPEVERDFCPTHVTLFPTDRCNLRCRYCYASAEDGGNILPFETARAAIDFISTNAKNKKMKSFSVGFHGNGEPFAAFNVIRECCEYIGDAAERTGMDYFISAATNGVMKEEHLDFILAWIKDVNVSFDILREIQNKNRPSAGGGETFDIVDNTLRRLNAAGVQFGIRATITSETVGRMREMAIYVRENYPRCNLLHFEPVFEIGRALVMNETVPEAKIFINEYARAQNELIDTSIRPVYSGARAETICCSFCRVCANSFTVTAEGNVTSCYEICTYRDDRAKRYIYGRYDKKTAGFIFDNETIEELSKLTVTNIPFCRDCFAKWHCGGDCAAKALGLKSPEEHAGSYRCVITRALIYRQLLQKMGVDITEREPILV